MFGWKEIDLPGTALDNNLHNGLGKSGVWQSVVGSLCPFLDDTIVLFSFWLVSLRQDKHHSNVKIVLDFLEYFENSLLHSILPILKPQEL